MVKVIFIFLRKQLEKQQKKLAQKGIQVDLETLRREYLVQRGLLPSSTNHEEGEEGEHSSLGHR
jgi:hypothetical protein